MSTNEAIAVALPPKVYLDLLMHLRKKGDLRNADEVVVQAVRRWMAAQHGDDGMHGYQWGELFLADGTQLRGRYRGRPAAPKRCGQLAKRLGHAAFPSRQTQQIVSLLLSPAQCPAKKRAPEGALFPAVPRQNLKRTPAENLSAFRLPLSSLTILPKFSYSATSDTFSLSA